MKNLPVGQQDFENLKTDDCLYVDKTAYIHKMLTSGVRSYFLSRPRRFGKSLLLSTVKAIFEGKRELFKGLYIENKINWEPHPVIMLDMTLDVSSREKFEEDLVAQLLGIAANYDVQVPYRTPSAILREMIRLLVERTGKQVVVLVDEYDKPILDQIDDLDRANEMRKVLYTFYGALKSSSTYLKLLVVTGITKISQTSIFSGFNNLTDLSFHPEYTAICGYTQQELENDFAGFIQKSAQVNGTDEKETLAAIKHWYNGYSWDAANFVYNPYSVLLTFEYGRYNPFWYSTGTPSFLLKLLKMDDNLETVLQESIEVSETFTDGQALENLDPIALMFQAGYLTIKQFDRKGSSYQLQIPNEEVRKAISELVLADFSRENKTKLHALSKNIEEGFRTGDTAFAVENLDVLLSGTTYNTHAPNGNESHYQALFQLAMTLSGIDHRGESQHWEGRVDAILRFDKHIYIVEIKYAPDADGLPAALATGMKQINEKGYHKPYLNQGKTIHLLALAFTRGKIAFQEEIVN
ncbi:PD-(D/E)XK nuclease superfamily protein [bacterium A37T11]|nr:PD-(D/E)XK nuclease superfamily protein [bacterium A37T11]